MRIFIMIILCNIATNMLSHAQDLSLELAIKWKNTKTELNIPPFDSNDSVLVPILNFTFRNLTKNDIYFRNIYTNKSGYPKVIFASLTNTNMDLADRAKAHSFYKCKSYQVEIGESWKVNDHGFDISKEHELNIINDDLWAIYTVLQTQKSLNNLELKKQLSSFNYPDKEIVSYREAQRIINEKKELVNLGNNHFPNRLLTEDEISEKYKDNFVFLKSGETYKQEVNLIGFHFLGGNYEFLISAESIPGYTISKDGKKINLPKLVKGYQLFERDFLTNKIGLKIN